VSVPITYRSSDEITCLLASKYGSSGSSNRLPRDVDELRRQVAQLPTIPEITLRLEAALGITSTAPADTPAVTTPRSVRPSDFSPMSAGLSQADSGFGSPPVRLPDDDDRSDYDGDVSDVELLDDSFDDNHEAAPSVSIQDGKGRIGLHVPACFVFRDCQHRHSNIFHSNFRRWFAACCWLRKCHGFVCKACDSSSSML